MHHVLTPHTTPLPDFVWWEGAFTEQELNLLQNKAKHARDAGVTGLGKDLNYRRSNVDWIEGSPDTEWVFRKLGQVVSELNATHFQFELTGFGEALQLTNYNNADHGMYGWHQDYGGGVSRKLSMVVQLTDPSEYEGGNLQIRTQIEPTTIRKQRGLIAVFPSYVLHQVTPVTGGSRQSLVAWVSGPKFK
jgi:PKHD-type hydroxylase